MHGRTETTQVARRGVKVTVRILNSLRNIHGAPPVGQAPCRVLGDAGVDKTELGGLLQANDEIIDCKSSTPTPTPTTN